MHFALKVSLPCNITRPKEELLPKENRRAVKVFRLSLRGEIIRYYLSKKTTLFSFPLSKMASTSLSSLRCWS